MNRTRHGDAHHKGDVLSWFVAIMVALLFAANSAWGATIIRTSAFEYDPASGQLTKEIIEPGDSSFCLVTVYTYDAFGHSKDATTRNCNGSVGLNAPDNSEAAAPAAGNAALFSQRMKTTTYVAGSAVIDGVTYIYPAGQFPTASTAILSQTEPTLNQSETNVFDPRFGTVIKLTGPNGLATEWKLDSFGRKILEKRADGNGTTWSYQYCAGINGGTATCPTVGQGVATYFVTTKPVGAPIDVAANTTGPQNGPITQVYFDQLNREIRSTTQGYDGGIAPSQLIYKDTVYDAFGRVDAVSRLYYAGATPVWGYFDYDDLGRVIWESHLDDVGNTVASGYLYNGLVTTVTTPRENGVIETTRKTKNVVGQVVKVEQDIDGIFAKIDQVYDAVGNLVQTVDDLGNTTVMTYDTRGRKIQMKDSDMGTWVYAYNAIGELVKQTDARNEISTFSYDVLGRMCQRADPDLISNYYYDYYKGSTPCPTTVAQRGAACNIGLGKLCEVSAGNGHNRKTTYDSFGRPISAAEIIATVYNYSTTYTSDGRVDTVTYPSNTQVKNIYTSLGYLWKVIDPVTTNIYWRADVVDAEGRATSQAYGNGLTNIHTYNPNTGHLITSQAGAANAVQNIAYTYDQIGNLKTRNDANTGVNASYIYDTINRLKTETRSGGSLTAAQAITFFYDTIGNIKTRQDAGVTLTYNYPVSGVNAVRPHAVTGITGLVNGVTNPLYSYDANGDMISATNKGTITWYSFDKIWTVNRTIGANTSKMAYVYGADHDRIQETYTLNTTLKRTTTYIHPSGGAGLFYEVETGSGVTGTTRKKHFINAGGVTIGVLTLVGTTNPTKETRYWHKDHLGSVMVVTNEAGTVTERLAYEPFGKRRNSNGLTDAAGTLTALTDRGFTGHEMMDEVGLVNMNGRIYDPAIARFMSADPNIQSPNNLQSYNRYTYTWNNPLGYTDPSGNISLRRAGTWIAIAAISAYTAGAAGEWYLANYGSWGVISSTAGVGGITSTTVYGWSASSLAIAGAIGGATSGFILGGVSGGNLEGAVNGAASGAITGGISNGLSREQLPVLLAGKVGTATALSYLQGGDWRRSAIYALKTSAVQYAWTATRDITDKLYSAACDRNNSCLTDEYGKATDGGRYVKEVINGGWVRVPNFISSFLRSGMSDEGSGTHIYDRGQSLCEIAGDTFCGMVRQFVRQVSKPHDWGNSIISYDTDGSMDCMGCRIEGGGYQSLQGQVAYEIGVQAFSFVTMPVMAGATAVVFYGDYTNPYVRH